MKIAKPQRFEFREAYRHMRRNLLEGNRYRNPIHSAFKYADAIVNAALGDLYGVQHFDVLVCGPDRLSNMILAYQAALNGKTVALYQGQSESWDSYDELVRSRLWYYHPSFTAIIENQLGLEDLGTSMDDAIAGLALLIDGQVSADGEGLVCQLDGCKLYQDMLTDQQASVRFWVEPSHTFHSYPTIERLLFWDTMQAGRFATEDGKCSEHCLEVGEVWMTGTAHESIGNIEENRRRCYSEAARPLSTFDHFSGQDRLKDLLLVLGGKFE